MCIHTHTCICMRACIHAYMQTCIHTHTHTHTRMHTHTCISTHTCSTPFVARLTCTSSLLWCLRSGLNVVGRTSILCLARRFSCLFKSCDQSAKVVDLSKLFSVSVFPVTLLVHMQKALIICQSHLLSCRRHHAQRVLGGEGMAPDRVWSYSTWCKSEFAIWQPGSQAWWLSG